LAMNPSDTCPPCGSLCYQRNGRAPSGKPNHPDQDGGRQLVLSAAHRLISAVDRALLKRWLNERLSRPGICRGVRVSRRWRVDVVSGGYTAAAELKVGRSERPDEISVQRWLGEADEPCSFVHTQIHPRGEGARWRPCAATASPSRVAIAAAGARQSEGKRARPCTAPRPCFIPMAMPLTTV
ncbi:MAG TPA: hypothetical protein VES89_12785, partial [Candidatus Competibacteraceae bacterium]|nr:hypothetical protein [Candidatus Competibacteraceae bacterium]